jgi:hypothetical protein
MTVLFGEATADFFTERTLVLWQRHRAENIFQTYERMVRACGTAFKYIIAVLTLYDNGIAAIGGLACLAKAAQEFGECGFHLNQIIRLGGARQNSTVSYGHVCSVMRSPLHSAGLRQGVRGLRYILLLWSCYFGTLFGFITQRCPTCGFTLTHYPEVPPLSLCYRQNS